MKKLLVQSSLNKWVLLFVVVSATAMQSSASGKGVVASWDFTRGVDTSLDWLDAWELETKAANEPGAFRVGHAKGQSKSGDQALLLEDCYGITGNGDDDEDGTPVVSMRFDPIKDGKLFLRLGTSGSQNQNAIVSLKSKGRTLVSIKLVSNTCGSLIAASGEVKFTDESWYNSAREVELIWDASSKVTFVMYTADRKLVRFGPFSMLESTVPDQLSLQVGYGRGVDKALRVERLTLVSNDY